MANKARAKKVKVPYRKYTAGQGFSQVTFSKESHRNRQKANIRSSRTGVKRGDGSDIDESKDEVDSNTSVSEEVDGIENVDSEIEDIVEYSQAKKEVDIPVQKNGAMRLPWEIQKMILQRCETIETCYLRVCKVWYEICIPLLYYKPVLNTRNFNKFVNQALGDKKKCIGDNVYELDLSPILQSGRHSHLSRVLRRCSPNLQKFTAPQTSFGYAPLISLKSCHQLRYLDLGLVSETVKLKELFAAIKNFTCLTHLAFPRSSVDCEGYQDIEWPKNLTYLKLSGGISNEFLVETQWPKTIKTLEFSYCPRIDEHAIYTVLSQIGDNLTQLYFYYPLPCLRENSLDFVFRYCTNLISIQLIVDYCSRWLFSENMLTLLQGRQRPLKTIYLECSGALGLASKIHPDDFTIAILEGRLPRLRNIRVSSKIGWDMKSEDVEDLVNAFEDQDGSLYLGY